MSYSFVWLYLIKCVFTCSIFVDSNTKIFLSILGVFGKYFIFAKTENFQKQRCLVLATQSRVIQLTCHSRELTSRFWRLVCEWKVQSWGVHRDFRDLAHDSLASETTNHEKHLANFFQIFWLEVFWRVSWRLIGDLYQSQKTRVLHFKTSFNLELFMSIHFLSQLKLTQTLHVTLFKLHFCIISSQDLLEKGMGFLCLTWFFMFWVLFSWFLSCHCVLRYTMFEHFFFLDYWVWVGCFCCWFHLLIIIYSLCANLCSELFRLLGYILIRFMGLELSVIYSVCEFGCLKKSAALVWLTNYYPFHLNSLCLVDSKWLSLFIGYIDLILCASVLSILSHFILIMICLIDICLSFGWCYALHH